MWFEPGPFAERDAFPNDPPIVQPGTFAAALDRLVPSLDAGDHLFGAAQQTIATVNDAGLDATFAGTIGHADELDDAQRGAADDLTAGVLIAAGDGADSVNADAQRYLPSPATPITTDFADPPAPPISVPTPEPVERPTEPDIQTP